MAVAELVRVCDGVFVAAERKEGEGKRGGGRREGACPWWQSVKDWTAGAVSELEVLVGREWGMSCEREGERNAGRQEGMVWMVSAVKGCRKYSARPVDTL